MLLKDLNALTKRAKVVSCLSSFKGVRFVSCISIILSPSASMLSATSANLLTIGMPQNVFSFFWIFDKCVVCCEFPKSFALCTTIVIVRDFAWQRKKFSGGHYSEFQKLTAAFDVLSLAEECGNF